MMFHQNIDMLNTPLTNRKRKQTIRKCFTNEEDQKLLYLVEKHDFNWKEISQNMGNRNVRQCKERYFHYLSPEIKHDEWTNDEDIFLLSSVEKIGKRWKAIEKIFKGRTEIDIRNRFYVLTRKIKKEISQNNSFKNNKTNSIMTNNNKIHYNNQNMKKIQSKNDSEQSNLETNLNKYDFQDDFDLFSNDFENFDMALPSESFEDLMMFSCI